MSNESFKTQFDNTVNEVKNTAADLVPDIKSKVDSASSLVGEHAANLKKTLDYAVKSSNLSKLHDQFFNMKSIKQADVIVQDTEKDWRLKLSLPSLFKQNATNETDLLAPLVKTNGLVFPYTPTVLVSQTANYQSIQPVHTNYPYYSYQNSQVDQMTITADFYVQNAAEARYWVACIHYLRSITKMNFGVDEDAGQPPPVVRLNGYGDYVFNNVPVIINSFQFDMPKDVDYISTSLGEGTLQANGPHQDIKSSGPTGWAPSTSIVTVAVTPQYSRTKQSSFSLNNFIKGGYMKSGDGFI